MSPALTKRESILLASLEIVQDQGLNELTTAKIARMSGTAETVIYRHFAGKHAIMAELLQRVSTEFQESTAAIVSENVSPLTKLANITDFYLNFIHRTRGISRILFSEQIHLAKSDDPIKQIARALAREFRGCVTKIIKEGVVCGQFAQDLDAEIASMSFMGFFYLLIHEWSLDDFAWQITAKKDQIIQHFQTAWSV